MRVERRRQPIGGGATIIRTDFVAGIGPTPQTAQNQLDYEKSLKQIADVTQGEYFYAGTATDPEDGTLPATHTWPELKKIAPASMHAVAEPAKPSHDFFGEITGAIGCLPNSTPAA